MANRVEQKFRHHRAFGEIMRSSGMHDALRPTGERVADAASDDPNAAYVATIRVSEHVSSGRDGRASIRVGAAPGIGERVESKRGTLNRALGEA